VFHNYDIVGEARNLFAVVRHEPMEKRRYSINNNYKISINIDLNLLRSLRQL
jgi:hypothetical protein